MKHRVPALLAVFSFFVFPAMGQNLQNAPDSLSSIDEFIECYTVENEERRRSENASIPDDHEFESWLREEISELATERKSVTTPFTIPVIFHVVHKGEPLNTGGNVAAEYIYAQIEQLNYDFRRLAGTSGYNDHPAGADLMIEFCPALVDPNGQPLAEPGIHRINGNTKSWGADAYSTSYFDYFIKPSTIWNPDDYLNIWVSPTTSYFYNVLGYAQFPTMSGLEGLDGQTDSPFTDGVVVAPSTLGSTNMPNPMASGNTGMGRTLTHELGHFFGLRHTWGDGDCSVDDYCEDTPTSEGPNSGCPTGIWSCGSVDMVENYMDYTDDPCKNVFTQDQRARVWAVMTNSPRRASLAQSTVCDAPQACIVPTTPPSNPEAIVSGGSTVLTWDVQPGTIGCQVHIGFWPSGPSKVFILMGSELDEVAVPPNMLKANHTYRWRVRCGCAKTPDQVGPWTAWQQFTVPGGMSAMRGQGSGFGIEAESALVIAPNPVNEVLAFSLTSVDGMDAPLIEIYDVSGRKIWEHRSSGDESGRYRLELPSGLSGVYVLSVTITDRVLVEKFAVE